MQATYSSVIIKMHLIYKKLLLASFIRYYLFIIKLDYLMYSFILCSVSILYI